MERSLEINSISDFCVALAQKPDEIVKFRELQKMLDFCYTSIVGCNCGDGKKKLTGDIENIFINNLKSFSEETKSKLPEILDKNNIYSSINISLKNSEVKIKVK